MRDRGFVRDLLGRVVAAWCSALVITLDLNVLGQRHCDIKNGMSVLPRITLANLANVTARPAWALSILRGRRKTFGNLAGHLPGGDNLRSVAQWTAAQFDPTLNWADIEWVRALWPGTIILKGILDPRTPRSLPRWAFQRLSCPTVADVSSTAPRRRSQRCRGGRRGRLRHRDHVRQRYPVRPGRAAGTRARCPLLPDRPCLPLRLGAGGLQGVAKAIEIIRNELDVSMPLTGITSIAAGPQVIAAGSGTEAPRRLS
jgi:L-lactate dehydrogenase (cytochrome)